MKKFDLGQAISVVANIGVIAGLIFVGIQLQLDRQIAILDGLDERGASTQAWIANLSINRDLWVKGSAGESLSAAELAVFDEMARARRDYHWRGWSRNQALGAPFADADDTWWAREAALEVSSNPGLMRNWLEHVEGLTGLALRDLDPGRVAEARQLRRV